MLKSEWTFATLKEYFEHRIEALYKHQTDVAIERNRALDAALASAKDVTSMHNDIIRKNERKEATYVTREQVDGLLLAVKEQNALQFKVLVIAIAAVTALIGVLKF